MTPCFQIEREHDNTGRFTIEPMNGNKGIRAPLPPQPDKKSFMEKSTGRNHGQEMRFVCNQDVFIPIENAFSKRDSFFVLKLTVVKDAGTCAITTFRM
jgi:hypothetical protein